MIRLDGEPAGEEGGGWLDAHVAIEEFVEWEAIKEWNVEDEETCARSALEGQAAGVEA